MKLTSDPKLGRMLSRENFKWYVKDGSTVFFWEDWWIGDASLNSLLPTLYAKAKVKHMMVRDFFQLWSLNHLNSGLWIDICDLSSMEEFVMLSEILSSFSLSSGKDSLVWLPGKSQFSSKVCRDLMSPNCAIGSQQSYIWRLIWKIKAPPKILAFVWKIQWNILPTRHFISSRIAGVLNICPWCGIVQETSSHLFGDCVLAKWSWNFICKWWSIKALPHENGTFSLAGLLKLFSRPFLKEIWQIVVVAVLWSIWLARNELVFSNIRIKEACLIKLILLRIDKWGSASGLMTFGADPIWLINPQGAVALRYYKIMNSFWKFKKDQFELIAAVDGAWGLVDDFNYKGGIGGYLSDKYGNNILIFSGPVFSNSAAETEVDAILHIINWLFKQNWELKRTVICSDSSSVVNAYNEGLEIKFPLKALNFNHLQFVNSAIFIHFVPRYLNEQADDLAKKGITRSHMLEIG